MKKLKNSTEVCRSREDGPCPLVDTCDMTCMACRRATTRAHCFQPEEKLEDGTQPAIRLCNRCVKKLEDNPELAVVNDKAGYVFRFIDGTPTMSKK